MPTTNNLKDTTIYGAFNNSNKTTTNAVTIAIATFEGDLNCNGDLYLGKTSSITDPETGLSSYTSTGGNIIVSNNGASTTYPTSIFSQLSGLSSTYAPKTDPTFIGTYTKIINNNGLRVNSGALSSNCVAINSGGTGTNMYGTIQSSYNSNTSSNDLGTTTYLCLNASGGNVVIGSSTSSTYKLAINGNCNATDYLVNGSNISTLYQAKETTGNSYITSSSLTTSLSPYLTITSAGTTYQAKETTGNPYITSTSLSTSLSAYVLDSYLQTNYVSRSYGQLNYQPKGSYLTTAILDGYALTSSLSNYVTTTSLTNTLSGYVTSTSLTNSLNLYLLKTTNWISGTALDTTLLSYLSTSDATILYQPKGSYLTTAILDGYALTSSLSNYVTSTSLGSYLPLSGGTITTDLTVNGSLYIKGQTVNSKIFCYTSTSSLYYKSGGSHNYYVDNVENNVFQIASTGITTTLSIDSPTIKENGISLSTLFQGRSFTATIKRIERRVSDYSNYDEYLNSFYFTNNVGFYLQPYTYVQENIVLDPVATTQNSIPYTTGSGLQIRFPNPSDKKFNVNIIGVYRNDNQTTNQALCFQINNKTNGLIINSVRHTYFYLRWSYNHLNTFLDSVTNLTSSGQNTYEGLLNSGFIDISVTLI